MITMESVVDLMVSSAGNNDKSTEDCLSTTDYGDKPMNEEMNDEEEIENNCDCINAFENKTFNDGRHHGIGTLKSKWNRVCWSPTGSGIWYWMDIKEFSDVMVQHCQSKNSQYANTDTFQEYAPLLPERALSVTDMTPEQRVRLEKLNHQLIKIEKNIVSEALPQIKILQARVNDPDDWLQDYECDCKLRFSLRHDDASYDEEDSENVIVDLREYLKVLEDKEEHWGMADGNNHNEFEHWETHPMHSEFHCWLFHCLYDHTHIGWANILRIGEVWIDIQFILQRWEYRLGEED